MKHEDHYTHKVAVNAYLLSNDKFLLLKRNTEPFIWAPPGGRLNRDEDPISGLCREVNEETNLDIRVIAPANTWFGFWKNAYFLLSIDYLATLVGGDLQLSSEHQDFAWVTLDELESGDKLQLHHNIGFQVENFRNAKRLSELLNL